MTIVGNYHRHFKLYPYHTQILSINKQFQLRMKLLTKRIAIQGLFIVKQLYLPMTRF